MHYKLKPDSTWKQVVYLGKKVGSFTIQGRSTGLDYAVMPRKRFPIHPNDADRIDELADFRVIW